MFRSALAATLSVAAPLTGLYRGEKLAHEFQRTQSRLIEMQSQDYLAHEHRMWAGMPRYHRTEPEDRAAYAAGTGDIGAVATRDSPSFFLP